MPEDFIKREEYTQSLERLHNRVDKIAETGTQIETSAKSMQASVDKVCNCIYDSKEGLMSKVIKLATHIGIQWWFIGIISVSLLGMAFFIIRNTFVK